MATKAEEARVQAQRASSRKKRAKKAAKHEKLAARHAKPESRASGHAGRKATQAFEEHAGDAKPSRKSSRKGANRLRADTNFNLREERGRRAPETRHEHDRVRAARVRGRGRA